jgi:hypothetical protein
VNNGADETYAGKLSASSSACNANDYEGHRHWPNNVKQID